MQGQDRKSMSSLATDTSEYEYMVGVASTLGAAVLSGLGGILLEMNYTSKRSGSLLLINMQLSLVSLPFALLAVFEFDWPGIAKDGWHKGLFRADTMAVILVQVCALRALLLMAPDGQRPRVILDHVSWWLPPCLVTSLPEARSQRLRPVLSTTTRITWRQSLRSDVLNVLDYVTGVSCRIVPDRALMSRLVRCPLLWPARAACRF